MKKTVISEAISLSIQEEEVFSQSKNPIFSTRLIAQVGLAAKGNKIRTRDAIVDTGALATVIPKSLWKDLIVQEEPGEERIYGITRKTECSMKCRKGKIKMSIFDPYGNRTPLFESLVYLCLEEDDIPFIIGFHQCLNRFQLLPKKALLCFPVKFPIMRTPRLSCF